MFLIPCPPSADISVPHTPLWTSILLFVETGSHHSALASLGCIYLPLTHHMEHHIPLNQQFLLFHILFENNSRNSGCPGLAQ